MGVKAVFRPPRRRFADIKDDMNTKTSSRSAKTGSSAEVAGTVAPLFGHSCALHAHAQSASPMKTDDECDSQDHGQPGHRCGLNRPVHPIIHNYPLIDELLDARRSVFGGAESEPVFVGYRNHAYHMLNFARQWVDPSPEREEKIAIAAVFHDIAAWPGGNLEYLSPSADQADTYLEQIGRSAWKPEMRLMIESHHKITAYKGQSQDWVEPIRHADWCDGSFATMRFGLPKGFVDEVRAAFPLDPFYPAHVYKATFKWMLRHPLNPIPILRW